MLLGSHLSIAGGMCNVLTKAAEFGFATAGMFVRNQVQWRVPPLAEEDVKLFRRTRKQLKIRPIVAHGSYLVNLAGSNPTRAQSIDALAADLERCSRLGIEYLVLHPGHLDDEAEGIRRIVEGIGEVFAATPDCTTQLLLETAAGMGFELGKTFEQIAAMLAGVHDERRLAVCLDTCHVFAAGYDVRTPETYAASMEQFDRVLGLKRLKAVHLNDSKIKFGRNVDRHQHLGRGEIGLAGLANFVNDPRLRRVPFIMETPKGIDPDTSRDWDLINAEAIRAVCTST